MKIKVTRGPYAGRTFHARDVSLDGWYVQVDMGRTIEQFKMGFDCEAVTGTQEANPTNAAGLPEKTSVVRSARGCTTY